MKLNAEWALSVCSLWNLKIIEKFFKKILVQKDAHHTIQTPCVRKNLKEGLKSSVQLSLSEILVN